MTLTIPITLAVVAFILTLVNLISGKVPIAIPVLLLCIAACIRG